MHLAQISTLALFATVAQAHFKLNYPPSIGFDDEKESEGPCGSFDAKDRKTVTDFNVGGGPIAVQSTHKAAKWRIRGALLNDTSESGFKDLVPIINQESLGDYCNTGVTAPSEWAGQDGVIQVQQVAEDGFLYQCTAVKFQSGAFSGSLPGQCKNVSSLKAEYAAGSPTTGSSSSNTSSSASSSSSTTGAGARVMAAAGPVLAAAGLVAALLI